MDYTISTSGIQVTKFPKNLSWAIFIITSCTISNLQPSFEGLKKTCKHIDVLWDTCLWEMTEFWLIKNELLKFHEVLPLWPIILCG